MNFQFGKKSGLYGRKVHNPIYRFAYAKIVPQEYILVYSEKVPTSSEEPELYKDATILKESPEEINLGYKRLDEVVILITLGADNELRKEHPDLIANELILIEEL